MHVAMYAALLLAFRIVSVTLIIDVIKKQRKLRKRPIKNVKAAILREQMYKLAIIALCVNFVPMIVDLLSIVNITSRPEFIPTASVLYTFSYAFGTFILTSIIWRMYRGAQK